MVHYKVKFVDGSQSGCILHLCTPPREGTKQRRVEVTLGTRSQLFTRVVTLSRMSRLEVIERILYFKSYINNLSLKSLKMYSLYMNISYGWAHIITTHQLFTPAMSPNLWLSRLTRFTICESALCFILPEMLLSVCCHFFLQNPSSLDDLFQRWDTSGVPYV